MTKTKHDWNRLDATTHSFATAPLLKMEECFEGSDWVGTSRNDLPLRYVADRSRWACRFKQQG